MHKNIDNHQKKFKKEIDEFSVKIEEKKYWEIIYEKQNLKKLKSQMSATIEKYKEPEEFMHRFGKKEILKNLSHLLQEFLDVMNFTIEELEVEDSNVQL